jgi:hypothetical protein
MQVSEKTVKSIDASDGFVLRSEWPGVKKTQGRSAFYKLQDLFSER